MLWIATPFFMHNAEIHLSGASTLDIRTSSAESTIAPRGLKSALHFPTRNTFSCIRSHHALHCAQTEHGVRGAGAPAIRICSTRSTRRRQQQHCEPRNVGERGGKESPPGAPAPQRRRVTMPRTPNGIEYVQRYVDNSYFVVQGLHRTVHYVGPTANILPLVCSGRREKAASVQRPQQPAELKR